MVGSPAIGSAQLTLDGRILSEDEFEKAVDELSRVPCDKKCLLALEDECRCRCGGANHGKWVKSAAHDASLDGFSEDNLERMPVVGRDIMRAKMELLWLARREIIAAYSSIGGLKR
jgi:hypothetical protein